MKNINRLLSLVGVFCSIQTLTSQTNHVVEFIQWNEIHSTVKFSDKFGLLAEAQLRFVASNGTFQSMQHQLRIAPDIFVDKHLSIIPLGYVYTWNYAYEQTPKPYANNEHRLWSQISYKHHVGRVHLQHRLRYEWRFNQVHHVDSTGSIFDDGYTSYRNRIRYRISANIPINHKNMDPKTWYIRAFNEFMFAFADPNISPTFRMEQNLQNRLFIGGGYHISKPISITLGVIYQMQMKNNGSYVEHNIGPFLSFNFNPNLTEVFKKKKKE